MSHILINVIINVMVVKGQKQNILLIALSGLNYGNPTGGFTVSFFPTEMGIHSWCKLSFSSNYLLCALCPGVDTYTSVEGPARFPWKIL